MKFFKNPLVAVLISVGVVFFATVKSVEVKFGAECDAITDIFYDGMVYEGFMQDGIAKHLKDIYTACDNINIIAESYNASEDDFRYRSEDLRLALTYSPEETSYIYHCYEELLKELRYVSSNLEACDLSSNDFNSLKAEQEIIANAQEFISQSGYNQAVREFLKSVPEFTEEIADMAGVELPEYFG